MEEFFGEVERETFHGAGDVDDEDEVTLWDILRSDIGGWLDLEEEGVFVFALMGEEAALDFLICELVAEDEVAIGIGGREVEGGLSFAVEGDLCLFVAGTGERLDWERAAEIEVDAEACGDGLGGVFSEEGIGDRGFGGFSFTITWADGGGDHEFVKARIWDEDFAVVESEAEDVAGENTSDFHREDVGFALG